MSALYLNDGLRTPGLKTEAPNDTWPGCSFFLSNWDFYSLCLPANGRAANISSQHQLIVWNFILQNELMKKRCQDGVSGAKPLPIRWIVINSQPVGRHAERLAQSSPVVLVVSFCSMSDRFVCRQFKSFSFLTQKHTHTSTHTHTHTQIWIDQLHWRPRVAFFFGCQGQSRALQQATANLEQQVA